MVVKVNGRAEEGLWFSADVVFATITVVAGDFVDDAAGVNNVNANGLDQVVNILETRGTVIGLRVTGATVIEVILDYGQTIDGNDPAVGGGALTSTAIVAQIEAEIDLVDLSGALPVAGPDLSSATFSNVGTAFTAG